MEKKPDCVGVTGPLFPFFVLPSLEVIKRRVMRQMWLIALALLWALAILIEGCAGGGGGCAG